MCAEFLPRLHVVGYDSSDGNRLNNMYLFDVDTDVYHKPLLKQEQPIQLGLQEVVMMGEVRFHPTCNLPDLKKLMLLKPTGDMLGLSRRCPCVTELILNKSEMKVILDLLKEVGWQLTDLSIEETSPLLLPEILQLCPNVKFLDFDNCRFNEFYGTWPENLFSKLEKFDMRLTTCKPLPSGFIKQV